MITLAQLNHADREGFVAVCGPLFEHSPWIADRTWTAHPFTSIEALHRALINTMCSAAPDEQLNLIRAHPDLVGRMARQGQLTPQSTNEQQHAGLNQLTDQEIVLFHRFNTAYHVRFGFPFVICARENKKAAILKAFPIRLANTIEQEIQTALAEIARIAKLRLHDAVTEG